MSFSTFLIRNLLYHWRGNLAVFLGIVLGSAVLTGALLVGDSLRGSLKALTLDQLGWVEEAMVPGRFFRSQLAEQVSAERRAPALLIQGSISRKDNKGEQQRVGRVNVFGVKASFWPQGQAPEGADFWASDDREVVLNHTLAQALGARVGDSVTLHLQRADNIPREALLGKRRADDVIETMSVKVRRIMPDEGMARFSLKPTPEAARNAFVPLAVLQKKLDLSGLANAVFVAGSKSTLQADLQRQLTLDDWGLRIRSPKDRADAFVRYLDPHDTEKGKLRKSRWAYPDPRDTEKGKRWVARVPDKLARVAEANDDILTQEQIRDYYETYRAYSLIESRRMFIEPLVVQKIYTLGLQNWLHIKASSPAEKVKNVSGDKLLWDLDPILIALADTISDGQHEVPYAIIAGVDTQKRFDQPLGDSDIILVDWPGSPLRADVNDWLTISYYSLDERNHPEKKERKFKVRQVPALLATLDDPDLTPAFPGITDKLDIAQWENPPFPYNPKRIKPRDEEFWKRYRTTPRAYVDLKVAQKLWGTRFGDITSFQYRSGKGPPGLLEKQLLNELQPAEGGFVFQPIREQALRASAGATDFGFLFLAFSFFLIASALLLVGLLVRLNIDRRASEMGVLLATGWNHTKVRLLLLGEGVLLTLIGGLVGLIGAMLYASLMLKLLAANWPGGETLNFLHLYASPTSFAVGYIASVLVSLLTLLWATRVLSKLTPRSLLAGETVQTLGGAEARSAWSLIVMLLIPVCVIGALVLVIVAQLMPPGEAQAGSFFGSGALLLTACLAAAWSWLKGLQRASSPQPSLARLGIRNAGRHAVRSLLTIGLLAAASFLIVAVESFHKGTDHHFSEKTGGSGGFAFYAEGGIPIFEDLNQPKVRADYNLDTPELEQTVFYPCRVQPGDDASCLNLYKPLKPRVMGISRAMIERGGFHFGAILSPSKEESANPWLVLQRKADDAIPAIIDANTAQWILKVGLGDTIDVNNDKGQAVKLRIVALLQESIFQSEVLIAEKQFLQLYPREEGFSFLLIDTNETDPQRLKTLEKQLSKSMQEFNMDVQTTASRLQGYLAVENTYLATFQALGGLGLILGAVGLAIVLLRGVWERRSELALLQALGFRTGQLSWLVLTENIFLLALGLLAGTVSALLAVAPHLIGMGAQVLWLRIAALLGVVLCVGLLAAVLAVWSTVRTPVLTALRRE